MKKRDYTFWVSQTLMCISFYSLPGYCMVERDTEDEMWDLIYQLVNSGYRVG